MKKYGGDTKKYEEYIKGYEGNVKKYDPESAEARCES